MEEQQHISTAFDKDLLALNEMVQELGRLAIAQFETAIDALATQHLATLDQIISNDVKLDDLEGQRDSIPCTGDNQSHALACNHMS